MRLIVMGSQAFGKAALETILEAGRDAVVAVYGAPDKAGRPVDPLKEAALAHGLPVFQPASFRDPAVVAALRAHEADLMVMAYVVVFVPEAARDAPRLGSICFHPSLLPEHRGPSAINWPIIRGATRTGFSWFYPTDGLDEGDILLQRAVEIGPDDTLGDVYFGKIFPAGVTSVLEAIELFRSGSPPRIPQDEALASYESWCRKADAAIDWARPAAAVYDLIRGCNPQPGAWTTHAGAEVQVFDAARRAGEGPPGTVVAVSAEGVTVQAAGGRVLLKRVRAGAGAKVPAADWAAAAGLAPGSRLGG